MIAARWKEIEEMQKFSKNLKKTNNILEAKYFDSKKLFAGEDTRFNASSATMKELQDNEQRRVAGERAAEERMTSEDDAQKKRMTALKETENEY